MPSTMKSWFSLRGMEDRIVELAELDFEVALLGDFERVPDRFGCFGEEGLHFVGGAEKKLLRRVFHPLGIVERCLRADADQAIMGMRVTLLEVVDVVARALRRSSF